MKRIYVDMDDTICDFTSPFKSGLFREKYPQSKIGFFLDLEPLEGAVEGMKTLMEKHDVWILTRPSIKNTNCYTEKAEWIKKYYKQGDLMKIDILSNDSIKLNKKI